MAMAKKCDRCWKLYEHYQNLIQTSKIDIFVSGIVDEKVYDLAKDSEEIQKLYEIL